MDEKECVCGCACVCITCVLIRVYVKTSLKVFRFWKRNKEMSSVCIYSVSVCLCTQQSFMSGRASCGLGQWSITLWW